jgi:hypothetical protein
MSKSRSNKLLLTIKDLKDLGIINSKRRRRKRRKLKLTTASIGTTKGTAAPQTSNMIRSDSSGMTGFGDQINRNNTLLTENLHLQNNLMKQNYDSNKSDINIRGLIENTQNDLNGFKANAIDYLQKTILPRLSPTNNLYNDAIDVPSSGGDEFFDIYKSNKKEDYHPNENETTSMLYNSKSLPENNSFEMNNPMLESNEQLANLVDETKTKPKPIYKMTRQELEIKYKELKGKKNTDNLTKVQIYKLVKAKYGK